MEELNSNFDAELKISAAKGKFFNESAVHASLLDIEGVEALTRYIEDNALASYDDAQALVTVRGVDTIYRRVVPIDSMMKVGEFSTGVGDVEYVSLGMGVAYSLGVNVNLSRKLTLYVPTSERVSFLPTPSYREMHLLPTSIFMLDAETDQRYVITSLAFAQQLFRSEGRLSAIGLSVSKDADLSDVKSAIAARLGEEYNVETRYEQRKALYQIIENEKRVVFFISVLVMLIASFTLIGSLVMLITDKKSQITTLRVLGAKDTFVERVFFIQGVYISFLGIIFGVVAGVTLTLLQQYMGMVSINSQTLIIDSYPVILEMKDVVYVVASVTMVNLFIIFITIKASLNRR